jgi:hypothetical protein
MQRRSLQSKTTFYILVILSSFVNSFGANCQSLISGRVQNSMKKGVSDISVTILQMSDSAVVAYEMTDKDGKYQMSYSGKEQKLFVSIWSFNIKRQMKVIENHTQAVNFIAEEGSISLREVEAKPAKIWGNKDTVNYLVSSFKDKKDIMLVDVLKKMPGIEVAESGQINYNGTPINKFYIENLNLLDGRYGIATNNISVDDISTVQVLEHHQPIKALKNTQFVDAASINLKIKNGRKGIFTLMARLGIGFDNNALWQEELTGMYFGKKRQHIVTLKTNNSGTDIIKELRSFSNDNQNDNLKIINLQQPTPPDIRFERYNFNTTHTATLNNLWKLTNGAEMNLNFIYYHNKENRHSLERTLYLLPGDSMHVVSEDISSSTITNNLNSEFRYTLNKDRIYFNNYLTIEGKWNNGIGKVITNQDIDQTLNNNTLSVNNTTHWIKRGENEKGVEVLLKNSFSSQPQHLIVKPGLYPVLFNDSTEYSSLLHNVRYNSFVSSNRFSLLSGIVIGDVHLNPTINLNVENQVLHSGFDINRSDGTLKTISGKEMQNSISLVRINAGPSLDASYNSDYWVINIFSPITCRYTYIDNMLENKTNQDRKICFQPSFIVKYSPTTQLELNAAGRLYTQSPNVQKLYTGYILQNYRSINRYETSLADKNSMAVLSGISYKNILNMFFAGGSISFVHSHSNVIYGQTFDGILTITQLNSQPSSGNSFLLSGRMSKGFDWKKLVISADINWSKEQSDQLRQNSLVNYQSQWFSTNLSGNMNLTKWLIAEYRALWRSSNSELSTGEEYPSIQSINQWAKLNFSLPFDINLNASFEHYYNSALQGHKNFSLADLALAYTYKNVRYSLDWTNILNTSKYVSAWYGNLNSYYSEYNIRPAQVMLNMQFKLF